MQGTCNATYVTRHKELPCLIRVPNRRVAQPRFAPLADWTQPTQHFQHTSKSVCEVVVRRDCFRCRNGLAVLTLIESSMCYPSTPDWKRAKSQVKKPKPGLQSRIRAAASCSVWRERERAISFGRPEEVTRLVLALGYFSRCGVASKLRSGKAQERERERTHPSKYR